MAEIINFTKKKVVTADVDFTGDFFDTLINEVNLFDYLFQTQDSDGNVSDITGFYLNPQDKTVTLYTE